MSRYSVILSLIALLLIPAGGVLGQSKQLPHRSYYIQSANLNEGEFKDALKGYQSEVRSAMKSASSRWIDSICAYTMLGECYYAAGDFPSALDNYNAALNIYVQYYNWMLDVRFPDQGIGPQTNRQLNIPWGFGARKKILGAFPDTFNLQRGKTNQYDTVKHGGTVVMAHILQADLAEIWECTALALYRRYELLGPLCKEDPLTAKCIDKLSSRPAPPNHWTQAWVDVALGMAYLGAEKFDTAIPLLNRGTVCAGQFDHPLTALAFLALGRQALLSGNSAGAVQFYHESSVAAVCFSRISANGTILEEAFKGMSAAHLAGNPKSPCPALLPAIEWSRTKAGKRLQVVLNTLMAENQLFFQKTNDAAKYIKEAQQRMVGKDMGLTAIGAKLNFVTAEMFFQMGQIKEGSAALKSSLDFMNNATPRLFQIDLLNNMYQSGQMTLRSAITPRKGFAYYESLLVSPTAEDWSLNPMHAFSSIACMRAISFDNWFMLAWEREEYQKAVMISDRGRRARFYSTLFAGGRLFNLRQILDSPEAGLSDLAKTQKQNILAEYPAYVQLQIQSRQLQDEIQKLPLVPADSKELKEQGAIYEKWSKITQQQETLLYSMLLRRLPVDPFFPPVMTCEQIQKNLPKGEAALIFYAVRTRMFAFLINDSQYTAWEVKTIRNVDILNKKLHKEMQLLDATRACDITNMPDSWRNTAENLLTELLKNSKADFTQRFPGLVIVPDNFLWYVPFDALQVKIAAGQRPLIFMFKIRYAPTASLAVPRPIPTLGDVEWTFAQGRLYPKDAPETAQAAFQEILGSQSQKTAISKNQLAAPAELLYSRIKRLLVWEDLNNDYNKPALLHPLGIDVSKTSGLISDCMLLPFAAPQMLILPGFHTPEECAFRQNAAAPGFDLFFISTAIMSEGTQTVLLSRWRNGGFSTQSLLKYFCENVPKLDPAAAWQIAVLKTAGATLQPEREPRVRYDSTNNPPRMTHPFFWGGYILLDSGTLPVEQEVQDGGIQFKKKQ